MKNNIKKLKGAFTLVEIIIAMTITGIFLRIFLNLVSGSNFLKTQGAQNVSQQIDYYVQGIALRNSTTGYISKLAVDKGVKDDKNTLAGEYMVYFQKSNENNLVGGQFYSMKLQTRKTSGGEYTRIIDREAVDIVEPGIYLKRIIGKNSKTDIGVDLNNFAVSFTNPTGRENFFLNDNDFLKTGNTILSDDVGNTLNEFPLKTPSTLYKIIYLEFWSDADNQKSFTYIIHNDKQFYPEFTK